MIHRLAYDFPGLPLPCLLSTGQDHDAPLRIVEAVVAVNDTRKRAMARKVAHALGGDLRGKTIAVLGLTFKPNTDDMREFAVYTADHRAAGHGCQGARLRSDRHGAGQAAHGQCRLLQGRL